LTEIPEILLENQMEHVNFWNAISKISDNLSRLSTNWKFQKFRNSYIPLKHFPTMFLLSSLRRAKTATKPKWRVLDHFCSASSLDLFRRMLNNSTIIPVIFKPDFRNFRQMESAHGF
jgi:hypothetical protein